MSDGEDEEMLNRYYGSDGGAWCRAALNEQRRTRRYNENDDEDEDDHAHNGDEDMEFVDNETSSAPATTVKTLAASSRKPNEPRSIAKTCYFWLWGICKYDDSCRYQHPEGKCGTIARPEPPTALPASSSTDLIPLTDTFELHARLQRDAQRIRTLESELTQMKQTVSTQNDVIRVAQSMIAEKGREIHKYVNPAEEGQTNHHQQPGQKLPKKQRRRAAAAARNAKLMEQMKLKQETDSGSSQPYGYGTHEVDGMMNHLPPAAAASSRPYERPQTVSAARPVAVPNRIRRKRGRKD